MIDSIRDRDVFVRLGREGVRFRREPVWCTYLQDSRLERCHVAFAIGRPVGPAVVRNRLRRRLRVIVRQTDFAPGHLLIGVRPKAAELTFDQLHTIVSDLAIAVSTSLDPRAART